MNAFRAGPGLFPQTMRSSRRRTNALLTVMGGFQRRTSLFQAVVSAVALLTGPLASAAAAPDLAEIERTPALWPREVTLLQATSFAVVYEGRAAGQTVVPAGSVLRVTRVAAGQVEVESGGARQWVAAGSTDLLARSSRLREVVQAPPPVPTTPGPTVASSKPGPTVAPSIYGARAREVAAEIQRDFWNPQKGWYSEKPGGKNPAVAWAAGVMFPALVGAVRNDPEHYRPLLRRYFDALNAYWDRQQPLGGYEPLPTDGNGHDKYYDDNEWLAIAFLEARALTGEPAYSRRAAETMKFVLSGWDEKYLHGGIWWHEKHEEKNRQKNTCANAPAAVTCLRLARVSPPAEARDLVAWARKITDWTAATLQEPNGLFADNKDIEGNGVDRVTLTYNSALMVRAYLGLYQINGNSDDLRKAQRIAQAANSLLDKKTGAYGDHKKWGHLMVEADLALYRTTKEPYLFERARRNADAYYDSWKKDGPIDLITAASISRVLWLMADTETTDGRDFWRKEDARASLP